MPTDELRDNPDELFDLVDADDNVIGIVRRADAHADPALLHRSVQVLVFGSDGSVLLQRRSRHKDLYPGYWCASAAGHVAHGESYDETASREIEEELGIQLPVAFRKKTTVASPYETEITAIYIAVSDGPFRFHPGETDGGAYFGRDELRLAVETGSMALTPSLIAALEMLDSSLL